MITRLLFLLTLSISILFSSQDAKFLVVDTKVYEKIELLNILNGGVKKEYIISSKSLSKESLKKYYPEYFLYDGPLCYNINSVSINDKNNKKITFLKDKKEIKKEIKKIKLLQMLNETKFENIALSKINEKIIKSVGVMCDENLFIRGKVYTVGANIGDYKIQSINMHNASISLEDK